MPELAVERVVVHPLVLLSVVDHFNRLVKLYYFIKGLCPTLWFGIQIVFWGLAMLAHWLM